MNYNLSIDICKLKNAGVGTIKGIKCIIIPVEANHIEEARNGRYYISATMWERTSRETGEPEPGPYGDTHYLRQCVSKEVRDSMTDDEKRAIPYIGSAYPMQPKGEGPVKQYGSCGTDEADDLPCD